MSTFAWQLTALKSAQTRRPDRETGHARWCEEWLESCGAGGEKVGQFSFQPHGEPTLAMSAAGILANQYLNADRKDTVNTGGIQFLMAHLPDSENYTFIIGSTAHKRCTTWPTRIGTLGIKRWIKPWSKVNRELVAPREAGIRKSRTKKLGGRWAVGSCRRASVS